MTRAIKIFLKAVVFYFGNHIISKIPFYSFRVFYYNCFCRLRIGKNSSVGMGLFVTGSDIEIGSNVVINRRCTLDGRAGIKIGNNVSISPEVYILSLEHDMNSPDFKPTGKKVIIEDYAWICARAIILPGVRIGKGAVVGAGAVVTGDVEPLSIVVGSPARAVNKRSGGLNYSLKYFPLFDTDELI